MALKPVSVSQLNGYIKRILQTDPILNNISVRGEISGLTKHSTGHWYFTLKDENSTIKCFLARDRVAKLRYDISEGMQVIVYGSVSVYEKGGYYSLNVRDMDAEGEGSLKQAFENLRKRLESEGVFDQSRKRPIPEFPSLVGVATSPTGAAVRDIITAIKRRNPFVDVIIYPCLVQGDGAAASICRAIEGLNNLETKPEVIIVGRGGGSAEDLWCFNEESVARAVAGSAIPVISAVGHEVDFVISDFAADLRAATPTAAGEYVSPHIGTYTDRIDRCNPARNLENLKDRIENLEIRVKRFMDISSSAIDYKFSEALHRLQMLKLNIDSLNPMCQLEKGYAMAKNSEGRWILSAENVNIGDNIDILFKDGTLNCLVQNKETKDGTQ